MNNNNIKLTKTIGMLENSAYPNNIQPLQAQPLLKLPTGSIKPKGWLEKQLELMLDGVTGRLYEFGDFFSETKNGWFYDVDDGWEEIPYWLRGFYPLAVLTNDTRCLKVAKQYIDKAIDSQDEDGYFGPSNMKNIIGKDGRITSDLWPHMLMIHPIISYYEYTKDDRIIPFLTKFFMFCKNLPEDQFILKDGVGYSGWGGSTFGAFRPFLQYTRAGDMFLHLLWFYNQTKEKWVLDLINRFHDHTRPPWDEWLDHHAVNFAQRFSYDGIYSLVSKDPADMEKTNLYYNQHMATWGQMPRGIFAADERIRPGCTDPRQAFETCGMVEFAKNFYDLGRITGDPLYGDKIEDVLLNHFPVTYTSDQKAIHYVTGANMPKISAYKHHPYRNGRESSDRSYVAFTPHNRCCGHNAGIGWPQYANNLLQATADNGLACLIYGAFEANVMVDVNKTPITLNSKSDYPFKGDVTLTIKSDIETTFPLYLRIPKWSQQFNVYINGEKVISTTEKQTWLLLDRTWKNNDTITITMAMEVSLTKWPTNGSVTIDRGPLSYSVKIKENIRAKSNIGPAIYNGNEKWQNFIIDPASPWNYGLVIDEKNRSIENTVTIKDCSTNMPWINENAPIEIKVKGKRITNWTLQDDTASELQASPIKSDQAIEEITFIPLGCARLRMSCLPVISDSESANTWNETPTHIPFDERPKNKFDELYPNKPITTNDDL